MKKFSRNVGIYLIIIGMVVAMAFFYTREPGETIKQVSWTSFTSDVADGEFNTVTFDEMMVTGEKKGDDTKYVTYASSMLDINWLNETYLNEQQQDGKVEVTNEPPKETPWYISMLPTLIMVGVLVFFWVMIMNQQGGGGKAMQFGRSRAKLQKDSDLKKITFNDVAGLDEEKVRTADILMSRFTSVLRSRGKKYMLVNVPNEKIEEALKIIPSMKSPTLLPLADKGWSAIHAVVDESEVWEKADRLKKIGAEDILVLSMEKLII